MVVLSDQPENTMDAEEQDAPAVPVVKTLSIARQTTLETWQKTEHYCPRCGKQAVWRLATHVGAGLAKHLCAATDCNARFILSVSIERDESETHAARLEELA